MLHHNNQTCALSSRRHASARGRQRPQQRRHCYFIQDVIRNLELALKEIEIPALKYWRKVPVKWKWGISSCWSVGKMLLHCLDKLLEWNYKCNTSTMKHTLKEFTDISSNLVWQRSILTYVWHYDSIMKVIKIIHAEVVWVQHYKNQ